MKLLAPLLLGFSLLLMGAHPPPRPESKEEELFVRRVVEFWRDQEWALARAQIEEFLVRFPKSSFRDRFYRMHGEICLSEQDYEKALESFDAIRANEQQEEIQLSRWHTLYRLGRFSQLADEMTIALPLFEEQQDPKKLAAFRFYYAESLFRQATRLYNDPETRDHAMDLCQEALPYYQELVNSDWESHAKMALAEIYRLFGHAHEAASAYLELADSLTDNQRPVQEELVFHASLMLRKFDSQKAIDTFSLLATRGIAKSQEAAHEWLKLLAEEERWESLIEQKETFFRTLAKEHYPFCHALLGKAYAMRKNHALALLHLEYYLDTSSPSDVDKIALPLLISAARRTESLSLLERAAKRFEGRFSDDPEMEATCIRIGLTRALAYRDSGKEERALLTLEELMERDFSSDEIDEPLSELYLAKASLHWQKEDWEGVQSTCRTYFAKLETPAHRTEMLRLSIFSSLRLLAECGVEEEKLPLYEQLVKEVDHALSSQGVFSPSEVRTYRPLLAKGYIALGQADKARELLTDTLGSETSALRQSELHYLLLLSYLKEDEASEKLIYHGERALLLNPHLDERRVVHLHLFNAYLNGQHQEDRAADHLYLALLEFRDEETLSIENLRWLADTYYARARNSSHWGRQEASLERARFVLEQLLGIENHSYEHLTLGRLPLEREALRLARIYAWMGEDVEERRWLEQLLKVEQSDPTLLPKRGHKVRFLLARSLIRSGDKKRALALLREVEQTANKRHLIDASLLEQARLILKSSHPRSSAYQKALVVLHEISLRKTLAYEPIYLEASLDYADFMAMSVKEINRSETLLEALQTVKYEFNSQLDLQSRDYHAAMELLPRRKELFETYMRYLDARILAVEGSLAKGKKPREAKLGAARALFSTFVRGQRGVTPYLIEKTRGLR